MLVMLYHSLENSRVCESLPTEDICAERHQGKEMRGTSKVIARVSNMIFKVQNEEQQKRLLENMNAKQTQIWANGCPEDLA